jgi:hypothetical protein
MGIKETVKAWSLVLAGRAAEVPPLLGTREDVTAPLWATGPDEPYLLEPKIMDGWRLWRFLFGFAGQIVRQPRVDARVVCLPAPFVASLRERALADLGHGDTFVSDSDVICAWLTRLVIARRKGCRSAPLAVAKTADVRSRLPGIFGSGAGVYVQNLVTLAFTIFNNHDESDEHSQGRGWFDYWGGKTLLSDVSLGVTAARIRQSLREQLTEAETRASFRALVRYSERNGRRPLFGEPDGTLMVISNWTKAQFESAVDFEPAVVRAGDTSPGRSNPPGRMLYLLSDTIQVPQTGRNYTIVNGRDFAGNYWITLYFAQAAFGEMEEFLRGNPSSWLDPLGP